MNELTIFDPIEHSKRYSKSYKQVKEIKDYVQRSLDEVPSDKRTKMYNTIHALESSMDYLASCRMIFETMENENEIPRD